MRCSKCSSIIRKVEVGVEGTEQKAISYQCTKCDYFEFEEKSAAKVIKEIEIQGNAVKNKTKNNKIISGQAWHVFQQEYC